MINGRVSQVTEVEEVQGFFSWHFCCTIFHIIFFLVTSIKCPNFFSFFFFFLGKMRENSIHTHFSLINNPDSNLILGADNFLQGLKKCLN